MACLGPTRSGSTHDEPLAAESGLTWPRAGRQGHRLPGRRTAGRRHAPARAEAARTRALHPIQQTINQVSGQGRVTVAHALGGLKRGHSVAGLLRHRRPGFVDEAMLAAGGLRNRRVATRTTAA